MLAAFSLNLYQNAKEQNGANDHDDAEQDQEIHREIGPHKYRSDAHDLYSHAAI